MTRAFSLLLYLGAALCIVLLLLIAFTKLTSGNVVAYLAMVFFAVVAVACVSTARRLAP